MKTMRKYIFAAVLLLVMAGTTIWAHGAGVLIGSPEQNVLYADIDNPLVVQANGSAGNSLVVTCKEAKVFQRQGVWYIHPQKNDSVEWISVKVFHKTADGKKVPAGNKLFRVKDHPEQLACILTPNHVYRTGDRVPVAELTDSATRIAPKYQDYMDYPESDLELEQFMVVCQQKNMRCVNDTLSGVVKSVITEALEGNDELTIIIQAPRIGKRTGNAIIQRTLKNSTFTVINNREHQ